MRAIRAYDLATPAAAEAGLPDAHAFMAAIQLLSDGLAYYDAGDRLIAFNDGYAAVWNDARVTLRAGMTYEEILHVALPTGCYPEAAGREEAWIAERLAARRRPSSGYVRQLNNGRWKRLEQHRTAEGGLIILCVDITEAKRKEEEVRAARAFAEAVIEALPQLLVIKDLQGRITHINRAGAAMLGQDPGAVLGCTDDQLFPPHFAQASIEADAAARRDGPPAEAVETRLPGPEGAPARYASVRRVVVPDADGAPQVVVIAEDVTERKAVAASLVCALEEARAADRAKSEFLATVSHEVRTPLNGVMGMAQAMAADAASTVDRERLGLILRSGEALLGVLNDVLDVSKIEAGRLTLETLAFNLEDLLAEVCATMRVQAEAKGLALELRLHPSAAGEYLGDPGRLRQVLLNLVSNAVKFTREGRVTVSARARGGRLLLAVRDTGIGIPPEAAARMFERFTQGDASTTRRYGGTGLGLAICRDLVSLMGGAIAIAGAAGRGARVRISLPLRRAVEEPPTAPSPRPSEVAQGPAAGLRVLVAEDNAVNQIVLRTLLEQFGVAATIVGDGEEAVTAWEGGGWDLVLMDVQMPGVDGLEATAMIRRREAQLGRTTTPIVALTADTLAHQLDRYRACGMDAVVAKPIQVPHLLAVLAQASAGELPAPRAERLRG